MSRRFRPPKRVTVYTPKRANKNESQLRRIAAAIQNDDHFQAVLAAAKPELRESCYERIAPYLSFKPSKKALEITNAPGV